MILPIPMTVAVLMAGVGRMDPRKYVAYSIIGALVWAPGVTLPGY